MDKENASDTLLNTSQSFHHKNPHSDNVHMYYYMIFRRIRPYTL